MGEGGGARRKEGGMVTPKGVRDGMNDAVNVTAVANEAEGGVKGVDSSRKGGAMAAIVGAGEPSPRLQLSSSSSLLSSSGRQLSCSSLLALRRSRYGYSGGGRRSLSRRPRRWEMQSRSGPRRRTSPSSPRPSSDFAICHLEEARAIMKRLERRRRERYAFFIADIHRESSYPTIFQLNTVGKLIAKIVNTNNQFNFYGLSY